MPVKSDAEYFGGRASASRAASAAAADMSSRHAHAQLALRYQALSERSGAAPARLAGHR